MTHHDSTAHYQGKASFEITDVAFQASVGTKMDAPRHRFEGAENIAELDLDRMILDAVVIDARHASPEQELGWADLDIPQLLAGKAILVNFGWDRYWGTEVYRQHPFLAREVLSGLLQAGIALFGVDAQTPIPPEIRSARPTPGF
ncbi:kynurenine formamidase [Pseudomonas frederiksbergensis]|uniref:cyclase family protein n=1 Tax=Pseudomonas frederiksbergensis TaxID=104087 RepID=UPI003D1C5572